ncbi:MAG: M3 family metallopeptidase [Desulforegulaceae bacterium]|nr:M3 family metallopeptidase [Desulforegulaceae bacterium]
MTWKKFYFFIINVSNLSPDESLRNAAQDSYLELKSLLRDFYFNKEIYNVLVKIFENTSDFSDEDKALLSHLISSFSHIAEGYGAGYYSYLWSLAIVHDFVSVFENSPHGFMDKEIGLSLRKEIFEPGLSRTEDESIKTFLGRNWNVGAYLNYINQ